MTVGVPSEPAGLAAARASLAAARAAHAPGPGPSADMLRTAYLELLKLCLCDLAATTTVSVGRTTDGRVMSRVLSGDGLRLRAAGMDWPQQGLTMVGLDRLDDLQSCVESVVRDGVAGDLIEAGAWRGGASILMRATLDSLGADEREVWVADSFQGFPAPAGDASAEDDLAVFDFLAVPLEEVRGNFARLGCERGVRFVAGFFEDTLPSLSGRRWSLVRLDADTYDATRLALRALYPGLRAGGHLIVDDYGALEECRRAVDEFRDEHAIVEPLTQVDWTCVRWRRESEAPIAPSSPAPAGTRASGRDPARAAPCPRDARVPTMPELALRDELAALRERLVAAEAELELLAGSPWRGPKRWLRRRLERARSGGRSR